MKRDSLLRQKYATIELKRLTLKFLAANVSDSLIHRVYYSNLLAKLPRRLNMTFFRNSCHRTGTGRSVFRQFKYSRHELKRLSHKGLISGFRKSSF